MNDEEEIWAIRDWFAYCLLEAVETLPMVFADPVQASRNMNRLRRHSEAQLCRTLDLVEGRA